MGNQLVLSFLKDFSEVEKIFYKCRDLITLYYPLFEKNAQRIKFTNNLRFEVGRKLESKELADIFDHTMKMIVKVLSLHCPLEYNVSPFYQSFFGHLLKLWLSFLMNLILQLAFCMVLDMILSLSQCYPRLAFLTCGVDVEIVAPALLRSAPVEY